MRTVLITLKGPLQSWGYGETYQRRNTAERPTKSGVTGLVASALGRPRNSDLTDITSLRFGVRTVRAGKRLGDFQTMGLRADGKPNPLEVKEFLMDAEFVVGLEGSDDDPTIDHIKAAFNHPVYAPYLGRRACPPAGPIPVTIEDKPLEEALLGKGEIRVESDRGETRWDMPYENREFGSRKELTYDPYFDVTEDRS